MFYDIPKYINDTEGEFVPTQLPLVIDTHVHIFPKKIFSALWRWFDEYGWKIRYKLYSSELIKFLLDRGVKHIVALQYAHKPGISRDLNMYMHKKCLEFAGKVTGLATVFPGEKDACNILKEAFCMGLGGVKLHAHVQCFDMVSNDMYKIYEFCAKYKKPIIMHVGREPKSSAYPCDPYEICSAEKLEKVLIDFPELKICVPHLGIDELSEYKELVKNYDNLWLDTTMVIADYFPIQINLNEYRKDRIMYGSDFPNIPYAWDRELNRLTKLNITKEFLERICFKNAMDFWEITI